MRPFPRARRAHVVRLLAALALGVACAPGPGRAQQPVTSTFTKQAVALRPGGAVPVFGQVTVGQRIDYVLTAMAQGPGGVPASGILDVLSPNQSYVPGSLHLPPGWTANPNPPYSPNPPNQTIYTAPAALSMLSFQLPVGGSGVSVGATGMGDGMYPIPGAANGHVYAVYHHLDTGGRIDCWLESALTRCPGFPKAISTANDVGTLYNFNGAVVQQRYIYYAAFQRSGGAAYAGLACWDTSVEQACPFQQVGGNVPVGTAAASASSQVAGALVIPGTSRVLIAVRNYLYCIDKGPGPTSTTTCPGWPVGGTMTAPGPHAASNMAHFMDLAFEIGPNPTRVYVSVGGTLDRVQCVTTGTGALCPNWTPSPPPVFDASSTMGGYDLHAIPTASGGHGAMCLYSVYGRVLTTAPSGSGSPACWSSGGALVPLPALAAWPLCSGTCTGYSSMALGSGAGSNRILLARWSNIPLCLEMGNPNVPSSWPTPAACSGWLGSNLPSQYRDYGFAPDPLAPDRCVLALGDSGRLYRFDGKTGRVGCPVTYQTTGDPMDFFCKRRPTQLGWSQIVIRGRPTTPQPLLVGGTIVVRNAVTQAVLMTMPVTGSNVYSIASIPYAANHRLTIEYTPVYSASTVPVGPYALEVQFTANERPQVCYQARVDRCGEITNTATFGPVVVPAPSTGMTLMVAGSPWTLSAGVNLGDALRAPCDSCPEHRDSLDLAVHKRAFYPPWTVGTLGEYEIVTSVEQGTLDPATAATPTFVDNLPPGLTFNSFTGAPDWTCVAVGQQVSCTYHGPPVTAGHVLPPVTIAVNVVGPKPGVVQNCVTLSPDANPENNRSCVEVETRVCTDLSIAKQALPGHWFPGGTGMFQITVTVRQGTLGPGSPGVATFTDVLPAGVTYAGFSGQPPWSCSAVGQVVSCTYMGPVVSAVTVLPPATIRVALVHPPGVVTNCAVLGADMDLANNRGCAEVAVH